MSLATARLTQLVVDDEITGPVRAAIDSRAISELPDTRTISGKLVVPPSAQNRAWSVLDEIVNCHACSSVWAGAGVLIAEQTGVGRFLVRVLALSQAALAVKAVIERIDR